MNFALPCKHLTRHQVSPEPMRNTTNQRIHPFSSIPALKKVTTLNPEPTHVLREKTLKNLLKEGISNVYSCETQLAEAMAEITDAAYSEDVQDLFSKQLNHRKKHTDRLENIFSRLNMDLSEVKECEVMKGLIRRVYSLVKNFEEGPVRDAALVTEAQRLAHIQIAQYASLCELSEVLGFFKIGEKLDKNLEEEEQSLSEIREMSLIVYKEAYENGEEESEAG